MKRVLVVICMLLGASAVALASSSIINPQQGGGGGGASAQQLTGWQTYLECDFSAQPNQTFATDANYTVCGAVAAKINSANEVASAAIVNGSGLVIQPASATDYYPPNRTLPGLIFNVVGLDGGFTATTPIRATMQVASDNIGANVDQAVIAIENPSTTTNVSTKRLYLNGLGVSGTQVYNNGSPSQLVQLNSPFSTYTTLQVDMVEGYGPGDTALMGAIGSAGFIQANLTPYATIRENTGVQTVAATGSPPAWDVLIGAARAGSATNLVVTIKKLKIELGYRN